MFYLIIKGLASPRLSRGNDGNKQIPCEIVDEKLCGGRMLKGNHIPRRSTVYCFKKKNPFSWLWSELYSMAYYFQPKCE